MSKVPPTTGGSGGTEKRAQLLPSQPVEDTGFVLPNYDFAGNVPMPASINVRRDDTLGSVIDAAKGVMYYTDMIGFGASTSDMTKDLKFKKLGINFFMRSGLKCTNGADMWTYFEGIPRGDALGKTLQKAMADMKYPPLRGMAPGMIEDAKAALDPNPLLRSMFGSVYPVCEEKTLQVGDDSGQIQDPESGDLWVKGDVQYQDGKPVQTRWVQKTNRKGEPIFVSREDFDKEPKTYNPDGTPVETRKLEDFEDARKGSLVLAVALFALAYAVTRRR